MNLMIKPCKIAYLILISLAIWSCSESNSKDKKGEMGKPDKPLLMVEGYIVKLKPLSEEASVSGTILPYDEIELKPEISGRIVKLYLPDGKSVKSGTLLVKLYDEDLQSNLKKLKTQLAIQEKIYQRQSELIKVNGISQNEYEQAGLQISSLKADIDYQKALIRKTEILAPFDGKIGLRQVSTGAMITPSTTLATFRSTGKLKLDFTVPEKYSTSLFTGMNVSFLINNSDRLYNARIIATETGIDKNTRNLKIRAEINDSDPKLVTGSFAMVKIKLRDNKNATVIPTQAIIPTARNKSVLISKNGSAQLKEVKTGIRKSAEIEIIEGLSSGDTVVTSGLLFLKDGMPLKFSNIK